jgi:hypothetical protein
MTDDRWTLVTIDPRARFARPVADAPVCTWRESCDAATRLAIHLREAGERCAEVWYVPAQGVPVHPEDVDNILTGDARGRTRRVPIRWDAEPRYTYPTAD